LRDLTFAALAAPEAGLQITKIAQDPTLSATEGPQTLMQIKPSCKQTANRGFQTTLRLFYLDDPWIGDRYKGMEPKSFISGPQALTLESLPKDPAVVLVSKQSKR